jgi:hypothetical protein
MEAKGRLYSRREMLAVLAPLLAVPLLGASGCQFSSLLSGAKEGAGFPDDYAIAVVKSNVTNISTYIEYYDSSLNLIAKLEYPYSTLENSWGKPERSGTEVLLCNQGIEGFRTSTTVVAIDTLTGKVCEYDTGITALKGCTATEHYVYATRNLNMSSPIVRIDRQTGERIEAEYPGVLRPFAYEDRLYAFNNHVPGKDDRFSLLVLDEELALQDTIDFGDDSGIVQATGFIEDRLYVVYALGADSLEWADTIWYLSYYSPADHKVHGLYEAKGMRLGFAISKGNTLFVLSSANVLGGPRNKVLTIDANDGALLAETPLIFEPKFIHINNEQLFVAGYDDDMNGTGRMAMALAAFDITEEGLTETEKVFLNHSEKDRPGRYYLCGLFGEI